MILEEELKSVFACEYQKLMLNILFTSSWISNKQKKFFDEYDISPQQYNILRILRGQKGNKLPMSDVACRMLDKNSNATRLADKLVKSSYIKRAHSELDRRQVDIWITEKGLTFLNDMDSKMNEFDEIVKKISIDEATKMNELLDKIRSEKDPA